MGIEFSPSQLDRVVGAHLPPSCSGKFCVAFSGGLDSSALLLALTALRDVHPEWTIRAIYIDHQLQAASRSWAEHCAAFTQRLDVRLTVKQVDINRSHAQGLEAAARDVRYSAFEADLEAGEVLLTAHHADDQLETLLLALMRGAGVRGLAAMPICASFNHAWHMRPLLSFTRDQLKNWAREQGINAIEDPSNLNVQHDRNYLRHRVLPVLRDRWPAAAPNATRTTQHLGEASRLLDELAANDWATCAVDFCLSVESLRTLNDARRRNLLRYWLRQQSFDAPSTRVLHAIEHDMLNAAPERNPMIAWPVADGSSVEVHRYRGLLYAMKSIPSLQECQWDWRSGPMQLPMGSLRIAPSARGLSAERLPATLTVRARREGESMLLADRPPRRLLKRLFQESGVLPWWRDQLPLLCDPASSHSSIVAIADLFIAQEYAARPGERAVQVIWDDKPLGLCRRSGDH